MKCWYCSEDMHRKEDSRHMLYWWCMSCGATYVEMITPKGRKPKKVDSMARGC